MESGIISTKLDFSDGINVESKRVKWNQGINTRRNHRHIWRCGPTSPEMVMRYHKGVSMRKDGRGWAVVVRGDYPALWNRITFFAKQRAGWKCEHCRMEFIKGTNLAVEARNRNGRPTILTVHHLDGNKADCSYRNLLVCCQVCHLHIQAVWAPGDPIPARWQVAPEWMVKRGLNFQPCQQPPLL